MQVCLFCKEKNNSFNTVEHIIPESLGNKLYVLPKGVVCDKCNRYFSKLDKYFSHYHLASPKKLLYLDKTKKGKPPSLPLQKGEMRKEKDGKIKSQQSIIRGEEKEQLSMTFAGKEVVVKGSFFLPPTNSKKLSRFLAKASLETLCFKKQELAYEEEFDVVRQYARYGGKNIFIPFLWGKQTQRNIDLFLCIADFKKKGTFYFATIILPEIIYFMQLNRNDEDYASNIFRNNSQLSMCDNECFIEREPIKFKWQYK